MRAGVVLASAALLVAGAACTATPDPTAPTLGQVVAVLARHAGDVRGHDRADFLSDLAAASAAGAFRQRQQGVYANLSKLPLATWTYTADRSAGDAAADRAATKRYGDPAVIVHVVLRYALRGVDGPASAHDLYWTFVQTSHGVRIAGDTDLRDDGGPSWQGPWDFGPLDVVAGAASLVLGHPGSAVLLARIAAAADAAVPAVTAVWGANWRQRVAVLVPTTAAESAAYSGDATRTEPTAAAFAVSDPTDPVTGVVTGQRLVVEPAVLTELSDIGVGIVFRHEITHIAAAPVTTDQSPTWLIEGFADYVGNLTSGQPVTVVARELAVQVRRGTLPAALPVPAAFAAPATAARSYEEAWLACRLIATTAGQDGLVRFYRLVGQTQVGVTGAVAAALRAVVHLSLGAFVTRWRAYLRAQLGG